MTGLHEKIEKLLTGVFPDATFDFTDFKHDGRHFLLKIESSRFRDLSLVEQHRLVYSALKPVIESGELHAVKLVTGIPKPSKQ